MKSIMKQKCLRLKVMIVVILNCFQLLYGMHGCENSSQLKCSIDQSPIVSEQKHWSLVPMNSVDHSNQGPTQIVEDLFAIITTPEKINRAPFSPIREAVNILSCDDKQRKLVVASQKISNLGLPSLQDPIEVLRKDFLQKIKTDLNNIENYAQQKKNIASLPKDLFIKALESSESIALLDEFLSLTLLDDFLSSALLTKYLSSQQLLWYQNNPDEYVKLSDIDWDRFVFEKIPLAKSKQFCEVEKMVKFYYR